MEDSEGSRSVSNDILTETHENINVNSRLQYWNTNTTNDNRGGHLETGKQRSNNQSDARIVFFITIGLRVMTSLTWTLTLRVECTRVYGTPAFVLQMAAHFRAGGVFAASINKGEIFQEN